MLKDLISSKVRRVLLNTFFTNAENEYYTRQLSSMHHLSAGTVHRELNRLADSGILNTRRIGNIRLFFLNKENPVYEELKNIFHKTEGAIKFIKDAFSKIKGIKTAFIYGSFAKGDERSDSDIDIFIIGDLVKENELLTVIRSLEKKLFREINYTRYTEKEYKKGKKENSFVSEVIKGKRIFIKGGDDVR
ncbi:MAG: nucleotidyltransferase domain-containing protein [Candidatus Omnitrophota bacterium]